MTMLLTRLLLQVSIALAALYIHNHYPVDAAHQSHIITCFKAHGINNFTTPGNTSFTTSLDFSIINLRFTEPGVPQPLIIVLPSTAKEVQSAYKCIRASNLTLRVRCGGHSYEGISSTASTPFAIIDLMNLRSISVDLDDESAWVEAGATLGELYYAIASVTSSYGFSAGTCSTVGVGGHIMGGGYGTLSRKYGLAADNVIDAQVITPNGKFIKSVKKADEELFWAIRGGGGGSWGIVVAWKVKLLQVPSVLTTFTVAKMGKEAIAEVVHKWQTVAPSAPHELYIYINLENVNTSGVTDMVGYFFGQNWGTINETVALLNDIFPELGLNATDCIEGNWLQAVTYIAGFTNPADILDRSKSTKAYWKARIDYLTEPISKDVLLGALDILQENTQGYMIFDPYGGIMTQISSDALPFPHRAGYLYIVQYLTAWYDDSGSPDEALMQWVDKLYNYMSPYVAYNDDGNSTRTGYVNYIDLELGDGVSAGKSYFASNFPKLVKIKARIDPLDVFNTPQSVPISI